MLVIPAVDLLEGRAVRLAGGERERTTIYSEQPWELAAEFARTGARRIHVVDLDGAFAGRPVQLDLIRRVLEAVRANGDECELEVGGGIREGSSVEALFEAGADKVVVGTLAVREPETVAALCREHPQGIVVAIDARDGMVAVEGWRETSKVPALELAREAARWGAAGLLYTDVHRDGLQVGAAVEATAAMQAEVPIDVIASGGVATLGDLDSLREAGVRAVVLGRALYERNFTLAEALARC
jgi:phosphoribosylformimino-5-aminoimidazole carboxamide ribotide isomerase